MPILSKFEVRAALARGADVEEDGFVALIDFLGGGVAVRIFLLRDDLVVDGAVFWLRGSHGPV